ncbi:MAG: PQQ-binding-like beta-propeller repeat protein [Planctomycetia bacterium]|nr:PQQ-binding-like beta-propeller repeat protein [Planctomycetia bacterium]
MHPAPLNLTFDVEVEPSSILGKGDAMWECQKCHERLEDQFGACWNCGAPRSDGGINAAAASDDVETGGAARSIGQLIFVGLNGYALALDRDSGEIVWSNDKMRSGYVTLLLDGDRLIVSTNGYMYCLDPLTGQIQWHNPLTGYGAGTPTAITSVRGQNSASLIQQAANQINQRSSE